ncbi:RES family NAD+ phosphorylase [Fangia hongkongensis]|uniref:RES family NAD+ phosphorylase n=1 Tax=Fangia hongkongensis TaxID=270495 RepID=UPI000367B903|nr:RES family NAD+ phosphorylase [Fangia hongkongensis]MBK2124679.1 RES domain-containing protein [Fangia hongkongensis]
MSKVFAYRLVKKKFANEAFTGDGARIYGGRWNNKGQPCVYCASSESLAILEVFVHIEDYSMLQSYSLFQVEMTKSDIEYIEQKALPDTWKDQPAPPETADMGDAWLKSCQALALAVPSVVVPREYNYILNTLHSGFGSLVKKAKLLDFEFDTRLSV